MAVAQYSNSDGVIVDAELLGEDGGELAGFYQTTDKDGNVGHVPQDVFERIFSAVQATPKAAPAVASA